MIKPKFYGVKKGGELVLLETEREQLNKYLQKFKDDEELEITVSKKYKRRTQGDPGESTNFNGYLWGVVYKMIGDEIGEFDLDYVHHWAQIKTGNVKGMPDGSVVPKGTSELSGGEFAEYCSKVRMWANMPGNICERGLFIPQPNEAEYD